MLYDVEFHLQLIRLKLYNHNDGESQRYGGVNDDD